MPAYDIDNEYKINSIADFSFILESFYRQNQISMFLSVSVLADKYDRFINGKHSAYSVIGLLDKESDKHFLMSNTKGEVSLIIRELRE